MIQLINNNKDVPAGISSCTKAKETEREMHTHIPVHRGICCALWLSLSFSYLSFWGGLSQGQTLSQKGVRGGTGCYRSAWVVLRGLKLVFSTWTQRATQEYQPALASGRAGLAHTWAKYEFRYHSVQPLTRCYTFTGDFRSSFTSIQRFRELDEFDGVRTRCLFDGAIAA